MKFQIQRETLLKPLQQVIGVVERRQTLPVLGNVLVNASATGLELTATDLEVELQARVGLEVEEPGEITIPARKLFDICRTLPEGVNMSISLKDDRILVQGGRSRFTLATLPASEFPLVEPMAGSRQFAVAQRDFRELIERTHFSMAQQDVRYYLNGLMLELNPDSVRAVATDGHRLALSDMAASVDGAEGQQVIVPRKGIQELV
ncbi:MAG TPA: DNA polymerase III subunit beta, partial [Gammaproteobacteria bacterium]